MYNRQRSCVLLHALSGSLRNAVALAVDVDLEMAKFLASRPDSAAERKTLWLAIVAGVVKGVVADSGRNEQVLALLRESGEALAVEDVLLYLSTVHDVDKLKDEICRTLEGFGGKIDALRHEMKELSESTESIVEELEATKKRGYGFSTMQRCEYCSDAVFSRPFYVFPCRFKKQYLNLQ